MNDLQKRMLTVKRELNETDAKLQRACERAEAIGDRHVRPEAEALKGQIIDRYNDDIAALSQRRWELTQELEELRDARLRGR